ncbi:hypothetical protein IWX50DRAFT_647339 [Phyllosticta citricarpa]
MRRFATRSVGVWSVLVVKRVVSPPFSSSSCSSTERLHLIRSHLIFRQLTHQQASAVPPKTTSSHPSHRIASHPILLTQPAQHLAPPCLLARLIR